MKELDQAPLTVLGTICQQYTHKHGKIIILHSPATEQVQAGQKMRGDVVDKKIHIEWEDTK